MAVYFISRHPGAIEWAREQGLEVDHFSDSLDPACIVPGDMVLGNLPMHLAAAVCERGARFFALTLNQTSAQRGQELTSGQMSACACTLEEFEVRKL